MAAGLPQSMRACQWTSAAGGLEKNLKVNSQASLPSSARSLGSDQTLVKVSYSALNPVDYKLPELPVVGWLAISKPASPSMDFSGVVAATGRSDLKPGQRVFGKLEPPQFGALAEYAVIGKEGVVPLPNGVPLDQAGCVGVAGLTAYQSLRSVKAGDKVFINGGSGGTGTFGVQYAKAKGCYVVTSCSGSNIELCKSLGADEVIDYRSENVASTLKRNGKQFDLIVDNVGASPDIYWQCHHYLKPSAKYVAVGAEASLATLKNTLAIFLIPSWLGGGKRKYEFLTCKTNADDYRQIGQWMSEGKVKSIIDSKYELDAVPKAFEKLKTGRSRGKVLIQVSKEAE